jgi:uncharacterized OsmC-like protein
MATITTHHKGDMLFETKLGKHSLQVDVPASMGGSDRGPTPPEVFVASLGACVAALVANYCNKAKLDTEGLTVDVSYEKASDPTRLVGLKVNIDVPNADISGRENAIKRVADRCPVHQTICSLEGVDIEVSGQTG